MTSNQSILAASKQIGEWTTRARQARAGAKKPATHDHIIGPPPSVLTQDSQSAFFEDSQVPEMGTPGPAYDEDDDDDDDLDRTVTFIDEIKPKKKKKEVLEPQAKFSPEQPPLFVPKVINTSR